MRQRLPNRRESERLTLFHNGSMFHATVSRWPDGGLAEIFLNASAKSGTAIDNLSRDLAICASLAFQFGCPADVLRHALTRADDGSAAGPLGALLDELTNESAAQ